MSTQPTPGPSTVPYFGRAWQISVATKQGTYTISNSQYESLRITFTIDMYFLLAYWQATISIYNLREKISSAILNSSPSLKNPWMFAQPIAANDLVTVSAGYQNSSSGTFNSGGPEFLFQGRVLQSIWTRENVVDYKLTLRCLTGLIEDAWNWTSASLAPGATAFDAITQICANCQNPIRTNIDSDAQSVLQQSRTPGSQAYSGRPFQFIDNIVRRHNLWSFVNEDGLHIRSFSGSTPFPPATFAYAPANLPHSNVPIETTTGTVKRTLIGVPQQTQDGVMFRVLMDSPKIGDTVQLAPGTLINPATFVYGGTQLPPIPSQNGNYIVIGIRHVGDSRSRGDDWYTEITAVSQDFFADWLSARLPVPG